MKFWGQNKATLLNADQVPPRISVAGASPQVLALHGFGATPLEVKLIVDTAQKLGRGASAPMLAGHGQTPEVLAKTRFEDWYASAQQALLELGPEPAIVAGFSMGSLLAIELARQHLERVRGLVLLSNPLWFNSPYPDLAMALAGRLQLPDFLIPKAAPDILEPEQRVKQATYNAQPLHAVLSLRHAARRLRNALGGVHCPVLILHGAHDHVCPVSNAWRAAERLAARSVRVVIFRRSAHILTYDYDRADVAAELEIFFQGLE